MLINEEPMEIKNLFNPVFLTTVLGTSVGAYQSKSKKGFPYVLSFLLLPLVLHKKTRDTIPNSANASLHKWINQNQQIKIDIENRISGLSEKIKKSIILGSNYGFFKFSEDGRIILLTKMKYDVIIDSQSEVKSILKKAHVLGKLFSSMDAVEIFALLGVRP
jgi:hypothetical protein